MTTTKKRIGRPTTTDPRVHRYNFKLTTEENIRFNELLCKAGLEHNRSRFIVKRIFAEEFVVVRRDPSKVQFVTRLNDFYFQIILSLHPKKLPMFTAEDGTSKSSFVLSSRN